ncbi:hypothetical protein MRB53_037034 [Persea americana]|nr:hypothetical protein MRB53_037034 [Persea americana]
MPVDKGPRVIFVGNIPYGERMLRSDAMSALNHYRRLGGRRAFGFVEFSDIDSAASAVRNLNDYEVMGRRLRVDYTNDGPANDSNAQTGQSAATVVNGQDAALQQPSLPPLPQGVEYHQI